MVQIRHVIYVTSVVLTVLSSCVLAQKYSSNRVLENLDGIRYGLEHLSRAVRSTHTEIKRASKDACSGVNSWINRACQLANIDSVAPKPRMLVDPLNPGKRSHVRRRREVGTNDRYIEDLLRKQKVLQELEVLLTNSADTLHGEKKRACNLNLGGHCRTEQYAAIADMYNWLNSEMSPGRRKRASHASDDNKPKDVVGE